MLIEDIQIMQHCCRTKITLQYVSEFIASWEAKFGTAKVFQKAKTSKPRSLGDNIAPNM